MRSIFSALFFFVLVLFVGFGVLGTLALAAPAAPALTWDTLLPDGSLLLLWLVQGLLLVGLLKLVSGGLEMLLGRIPVIGGTLANLVRVFAGQYERWLTERVPRLAEVAVLATEERFAHTPPTPQRSGEKLQNALEQLKNLAPGLDRQSALQAIEAQLTRARAMGYEQKALKE